MSRTPSPAYLAPQLRQSATTRAMMADVMVALIPAAGMAVYFFGPRVLALCAVSVAACVFFEWLYRRLTRQSVTVGDLSACVTGLLLALSLPASSPYWIPVLGGAFGIIVVKQFYGGLGRNFMNPALAGRMLAATFPILMTSWPQPLQRLGLLEVDAVSAATPLSYLHEGTLPPQGLDLLFLGDRGGCMGEVSAFALLLGFGYLLLRRVISPRVPLAYLGTAAVLCLVFYPAGVNPLVWTTYQLLSGGLLMGAVFFATDPATTPVTPRGQLMFGVGCGLLTMLLRYCGSYPEGVGWAILTMNCLVWLMDRLGMPRRFGVSPFTVTRRWFTGALDSLREIRFVRPSLPAGLTGRKAGQAPGERYLDTLRAHGRTLGPLLILLAVTAGLLTGLHVFTDLDTARAELRQRQELLAQVMPQASTSSETPYRANGALSIQAGYTAQGELAGYCVEVQSQGFSGVITMVVGVDLNGEVTGVAVTSHSETSAIGTQAMTPEALERYVGRSGTLRDHGDNAVDAVAGATATSRAITAGVNRALAIVANLDTEGEVPYADGQP